jgi:hypothetical protein
MRTNVNGNADRAFSAMAGCNRGRSLGTGAKVFPSDGFPDSHASQD